MTKEELKTRLKKENIDPHAYSLEGGVNRYDAYCLDHQGNAWLVYFSERGEKSDLQTFESELEACDFFLRWIIEDPSTRHK